MKHRNDDNVPEDITAYGTKSNATPANNLCLASARSRLETIKDNGHLFEIYAFSKGVATGLGGRVVRHQLK